MDKPQEHANALGRMALPQAGQGCPGDSSDIAVALTGCQCVGGCRVIHHPVGKVHILESHAVELTVGKAGIVKAAIDESDVRQRGVREGETLNLQTLEL